MDAVLGGIETRGHSQEPSHVAETYPAHVLSNAELAAAVAGTDSVQGGTKGAVVS